MTRTLKIEPIGSIHAGEGGFYAELLPQYRPALSGLEGFGHVNLIWWFDRCDGPVLVERAPYRGGPEALGVFATRSPRRPNPLAVSCAGVTGLDLERGVLWLDYVDAFDGTPLLDVKPYVPSLDRVAGPLVPAWCAHWPGEVESSGDFDWAAEFNF